MHRFDTLLLVVLLLFSFSSFISAAEISLPNRQWVLLTVPANADGQTIESLFADDLSIEALGTEWVIYRFDKTSQSYVAPTESDSLRQGDGFWIAQVTGSEVIIDVPDSLPSGDSPSSQSCLSSNGCFSANLPTSDSTANWAIVGAPFKQAVSVANIRVQSNQQPCTNGCSLSDAGTAGLLYDNQWVYDTSSSNYKSLVQVGTLQPWHAFWVSAQASPSATELALLLPAPETNPDDGDRSVTLPRTDAAGNLLTGQNSGLPTAIGFGNWSGKEGVLNTLSTACIDLHDSYWVQGPDGKAYPTWHPAGGIHPETGEGCVFGHEHGNDPSKAPAWLFEYSGGWPPFGYVMEQLSGNRHEDHFGHKVTVTKFRAAIGNTANSKAAMYDAGFDCNFISKIHQGAHSEDAFSNHLHEYFLTVACDDDPGVINDREIRTLASVKTMLPYGAPNRFRNSCFGTAEDEDNNLFYSANVLGLDGIKTIMPAMQTFPVKPDNQLNDRGFSCVNPGQGSFIRADADYMDELDLWHQIHSVKGPGNVSFEFNPYYIVKDIPRVHVVAKDDGGKRIGNGQIRYTIDECQRLADRGLEFCSGAYIDGTDQVYSPFSIHSPFKGALRAINFKSFNIYNNSSGRAGDEFCTDAYGNFNNADVTNGQCNEGILQRISNGFDGNTNMWSWTNPQTGVTGAVTGAFEIYGQQFRYPNPSYAKGESSQAFVIGIQRPDANGNGCPRESVYFPYQNSQHAYCPPGIGFERVIDQRNVVPEAVKNMVSINSSTGKQYNTDIHAPN